MYSPLTDERISRCGISGRGVDHRRMPVRAVPPIRQAVTKIRTRNNIAFAATDQR